MTAQTTFPVTLKLWPNGAPGTPTTQDPETSIDRPEDNRGKIHRITNVTEPTLTVYRPTSAEVGITLVVFPGGAYRWLSMDIEGSEVCDWFNRAGVTCIVVKYRVPQADRSNRYEQPLQDAQRALGLIRLHAGEWKIDPHRVGILGFSAGAHVAAVLSNKDEQRAYKRVDEADDQSCRPDFAVLMYPGYLTGSKNDGSISPEVKPSSLTPPTFLFQTEDDSARVENSLYYFAALKEAKVPAEMHIYPAGGHGYGLRPNNPVAAIWPNLALKWMEGLKLSATAKAP